MTHAPKPKDVAVLYNAECPVCRFEIDHYRAYCAKQDLGIDYQDLNTADTARWGLSADQAARRLYLRRGDEMLSGIPAFLVLWSEMPRYRWLARLVGLPGLRHIAGWTYDYVLAPIIYRWHLRRKARQPAHES